ncbi:MAG: hypothetical protein LAT76_07740 [Schleiferiaceae bacterium]|nr:hypothetical protein [Schleiferiaceae bacterium]
MKKGLIVLQVTVLLLSFYSCTKDKEIDTPQFQSIFTGIIGTEGGEVEADNGLKIILPEGALPGNTEISIGYTGNEPTSIVNQNVEIVGKVFSLSIAQDSLMKTAFLEIPLPANFTDMSKLAVFIENDLQYFPLFFDVDGSKVIAQLDILNFNSGYSSTLKSSASQGITILSVMLLVDKQTPSNIEMGLQKVTKDNSGEFIFTQVPPLNNNERVLLLVHGWLSGPQSAWSGFYDQIIPLIQSVGYSHIVTFGYNSSLNINDNGLLLKNEIQSKLNGASVDIVSHSMGGLVSRSTIENHNGASLVSNLITLATPHHGSPLAAIRYFMGFLIGIDKPILLPYFALNTQGIKDMDPNLGFITSLRNNPQSTVPYYAISAENSPCQGLGGLCWVPSFDNILPGKDDGVVAETSALGVAQNSNINLITQFSISHFMAHRLITTHPTVVQSVAMYLNSVNTPLPQNDLIVVTGNAANTTNNQVDIENNNVSSQIGGSLIKGVCWDTLPNPVVLINSTIDGNSVGPFNSTLYGLRANTTYYVKAYATNALGTVYGSEISFTTSSGTVATYPPGTVHCNSTPTVVVDVTNPITGKTWMDRNLGASQAATSSTDSLAYGDLYQWGRGADGHQCRNSLTTTTLSSIDQPGHGSFIIASSSPNDWRSPQNINLWQGVNGVNNPCPSGYRLPTYPELQFERQSWSTNNSTGAFSSAVKWAMAGKRNPFNGLIEDIGLQGILWSSSHTVPSTGQTGTGSLFISFSPNHSGNGFILRAFGHSVRCIKD